jgi:hypothetical protein
VARLLIALGSPTRILGHSGGAVLAELTWPDGSARRAALVCAEDGQRMAALPCALAAAALASGHRVRLGAATAYELLGYRELLQAMAASGYPIIDA